MSVGRRTRRLQKKRLIQNTPQQLVDQIQDLMEANASLHMMNMALVNVFKGAKILLEMRSDDPNLLPVRMKLREHIDAAQALQQAILDDKVSAIQPQPKGENDGTNVNRPAGVEDNQPSA